MLSLGNCVPSGSNNSCTPTETTDPHQLTFRLVMNNAELFRNLPQPVYVLPPIQASEITDKNALPVPFYKDNSELIRRLASEKPNPPPAAAPTPPVASIPTVVPKTEPPPQVAEDKGVNADAEAPGEADIHCVFSKPRKHSRRQSQRLRMRPWLLMLLNTGEVPGLQWVRKEEQVFSIPWKHASGRTWKGQDADLFERYAIHTGKHKSGGQPDHKRWKANFRCALNSLNDVEELYDRSMKTGEFAYKLYRFLDPSEKKTVVKKSSKHESNSGDVGDMVELSGNKISRKRCANPMAADGKPNEWIFMDAPAPANPPEIKDHSYSFHKVETTKGDGASPPIIDAETIRELLNKRSQDTADSEDNGGGSESPEIEDSTDMLPRLPQHRGSVDATIETVIKKSRKRCRVKSAPIMESRSTCASMDVDQDLKSRFDLAQSLASLSGEGSDISTEDTSVAASILLDLSRVKHTGVKKKLYDFVSDRRDIEASCSSNTPAVLAALNLSEVKESETKKSALKRKRSLSAGKGKTKPKVTANQLLIRALSGSPKKHKQQQQKKSPSNTNSQKLPKNAGSSKSTVPLPLDLSIKTEPMDDGYEFAESSVMETKSFPSEPVTQHFTNSLPSSQNLVYRSSVENSDSEDEESGVDFVPPPAHSYGPSSTATVTDELPQPLDLSIKVHNLVLTDKSPQAKATRTSRELDQGNKQMNIGEESSDVVLEPLNLKVQKAHNKKVVPSLNSDPVKDVISSESSMSDADSQVVPLDLSIVKTEPMDSSYGDVTDGSSDVSMETMVTSSLGPVPDLIEAPSEEVSTKQDTTMDEADSPTVESPLGVHEDYVVVVPQSVLNSSHQNGNCSSGVGASNTPKPESSSISSSSPTIKYLLKKNLNASLSCRFCNKDFSSYKVLMSHMSSAHEDAQLASNLFLCPLCPKGFRTKQNLKKHVKRHVRKCTGKCTGCNTVFKSPEDYDAHQSLCHGPEMIILRDKPVSQNPKKVGTGLIVSEDEILQNPYQCGICNSAFELLEELKLHMTSHLLVTVNCSFCDRVFQTQTNKRKSVIYVCPKCNTTDVSRGSDEAPTDLSKSDPSCGMSLLLQAAELEKSSTDEPTASV